jgi:hypothetical protein
MVLGLIVLSWIDGVINEKPEKCKTKTQNNLLKASNSPFNYARPESALICKWRFMSVDKMWLQIAEKFLTFHLL